VKFEEQAMNIPWH